MPGLLWRWRWTAAATVGLVAVIVTGLVLVFAGPGRPGTGRQGAPGPGETTAALPYGGQPAATLVVAAGTTALSVTTANLGSTLVRATVPADATVRPVLLSRNDGARLTLVTATGSTGNYPVRVQLSAAVSWRIDFAGGTRHTVADLRGGKVSGVTFGAGSDVIDLTLPRPSGTCVIRLDSGASQFRLTLPSGIPARVTAGSGAALLTVGSAAATGVAGGTVLTPPGWAGAGDRFDIDAASGVDTLTVGRW